MIFEEKGEALFRSKDLRVIRKAADVMGVPWIFLVGYAEEYLDFARQYPGEYGVSEDIPTGDSVEDRRARQKLIQAFYARWKELNPELRVFNDSLQDYIYVKYISIQETAGHASFQFLPELQITDRMALDNDIEL